MTKSTLPETRNPKIWKPLHRLYQQQLFISALPELLQKKILSNSIFVLNISTQFFCRKANHQAYIEIEPKNIALKVHSLKKQGWNISILDCMFENAYQALKNTNKVKITNSATFCCFGFTIGNYNQYKIWRIFNSIASLYKSTNVLFSLQLTEKASYLKENLNFYNNKIFLDFISKPFETITQIKLKEPQIEFQNNIDGYFSGFIYKYNITTPINIRLENEKSFLLNQSKTVEIYRSIKPTLDEYNHFLATINNKMEVIHNQNEVSILKVLL